MVNLVANVFGVLFIALSVGAESPKTLELFVTCDKTCYDNLIDRPTSPEQFIIDTVENVDLRMGSLDVKVVLVGMEIWNIEDKMVTVEGENMVEVQTTYGNIRKTEQLERNGLWSDASVLLSGRSLVMPYGNEPNGIFGEGTVCMGDDAVGVVTLGWGGVEQIGTTLTHELGHGIGIAHDGTNDCHVGSGDCVMAETLNAYQIQNAVWSSASISDFATFLSEPHAKCLLDAPTKAYSSGVCGNGVVESGEECDCGQGCAAGCCDCCESDCTLKSTSDCAVGECCDSCQYLGSNSVCRTAQHSTCDTDTTCTGSSETCPESSGTNGDACTDANSESGYCVYGRCQTHTDQCTNMWTSGYVYEKNCYDISITMAGPEANCGVNVAVPYSTYDACTTGQVDNYKCSILNCESSSTPTGSLLFRTPMENVFVNQDTCWSGMQFAFEAGSGTPTKVMVSDGTMCDTDKACYQSDCIDKTTAFSNMATDAAASPPAPAPACGNGIVESGEQCDCGPMQCPCCDIYTCQYLSGDCPSSPCEVCDGVNEQSQPSSTRDFNLCGVKDGAEHCYSGECVSLNSNCLKYFGASGKPAKDTYYKKSTTSAAQTTYNAGGFAARNLGDNTWITSYENSVGNGHCGMLMCSASGYGGTDYNTYSNYENSTVWFKFFKRGDLDDGNGVVYNVMTPLVVDEGTPCKNTGAQGVDDVKGYCVHTIINPGVWNEYTQATCTNIPV